MLREGSLLVRVDRSPLGAREFRRSCLAYDPHEQVAQ
jgi:hypothetical protein